GDSTQILFVTPEQLDSKSKWGPQIIEALKGKIDLLVFDEAHHSRLDGGSFRPKYKDETLNDVWKKLDEPQCLFLSASLSRAAKRSLKRIAPDRTQHLVKGPLTRANVTLEVRRFEGKKAQEEKMASICLLIQFMKQQLGIQKIIVYVNRPARVVQMVNELKATGLRKIYGVHGEQEKGKFLSKQEIEANQKAFEEGSSGVMVCTSAYAEGIDVDAAGVIVADLPVNLETLYQMVLRAGHQGQPALSVICDDQKSRDFVRYALLKDEKKCKTFEQDFKFLLKGRDLWGGLTKKFL
ncbi:MAG: helicase-related protein, partial [SAR324 cluster bacterium]|nr:helicase-related protein [SAR324 cluster bacterium]